MHRAGDRVKYEQWLTRLDAAADQLSLDDETRSIAVDMFLADVPSAAEQKRTALAASLYASTRITGVDRSQRAVADAAGVSRLSVQQQWKQRLRLAGFETPGV